MNSSASVRLREATLVDTRYRSRCVDHKSPAVCRQLFLTYMTYQLSCCLYTSTEVLLSTSVTFINLPCQRDTRSINELACVTALVCCILHTNKQMEI